MGVAIINTYLVLLFLLVHFKIVRFNLFWKVSPFLVILLTLFGLLVPMGWGAPQGSALVVRHAVSIVPDVAGEVTDVPVSANMPLNADVVRRLPAGATGTAAIYTDHLKPTHVVRRVILRQIAIVNYVNPF